MYTIQLDRRALDRRQVLTDALLGNYIHYDHMSYTVDLDDFNCVEQSVFIIPWEGVNQVNMF